MATNPPLASQESPKEDMKARSELQIIEISEEILSLLQELEGKVAAKTKRKLPTKVQVDVRQRSV